MLLCSCEFYGLQVNIAHEIDSTVGQCGKLFAVPSQINQAAQVLLRTQIQLANEFSRFFISVGQKAADDSAELARLHDLPTIPVYLGSTYCDELFDLKAIT